MADVPGGPPLIPPPPDGPQGAGELRPRRPGEILSDAFQVYRTHARELFLVVAVVVVPLSLLSALSTHVVAGTRKHTVILFGRPVTTVESRGLFLVLLGGLIAATLGIVIWAVLQAAILRAAAQATIGDAVDVPESYRRGFRRLGSVLLLALMVGITVAIGFLLFIIPGLMFLVFFSVSVPVLIIEGRRGTEAMRRSWNLVSGHFWHAAAVIVLAALIAGFVSGILGSIGGSSWFLRWIFTAVAQIITTPFVALVSVLLYLDLRARTEALTRGRLRSELGSSG
jgi:hypothetical protein